MLQSNYAKNTIGGPSVIFLKEVTLFGVEYYHLHEDVKILRLFVNYESEVTSFCESYEGE